MPNNRLRIIVRGCHNLSAYHQLVARGTAKLPPGVEAGLLPCSSKIEAHQVLKFFEQGVDGVLILACPLGACRFVEGNLRAAKRVAYAATWLAELGLEANRAKFVAAREEPNEELIELITDFYHDIKGLGPTFVKGPSPIGGVG